MINLVRISTLYLLQPYGADLFETVHVAVWPMAILVTSVGLWILWAGRALKPAA